MILSDPVLMSAQSETEARERGTFTRLLGSSLAVSYWAESVELL